jgi:hypothetical protein
VSTHNSTYSRYFFLFFGMHMHFLVPVSVTDNFPPAPRPHHISRRPGTFCCIIYLFPAVVVVASSAHKNHISRSRPCVVIGIFFFFSFFFVTSPHVPTYLLILISVSSCFKKTRQLVLAKPSTLFISPCCRPVLPATDKLCCPPACPTTHICGFYCTSPIHRYPSAEGGV